MATFKFNALNSSGQEIVDDIEAPTQEEAVAKVRSLGYFPTKVREHPPSLKVAKGQQPSSGLPRIGAIVTPAGYQAAVVLPTDTLYFTAETRSPEPQSCMNGKVVGVLPPDQCFSSTFGLPPIEAKKIPDIVRFEANQQIPFDIDDVYYDYVLFDNCDTPDLTIYLFACRRDLIAQRCAQYTEAGIKLDYLVPPEIAFWAIASKVVPYEESHEFLVLVKQVRGYLLCAIVRDHIWSRFIPIKEDAEDINAEVRRNLAFYFARFSNRDTSIRLLYLLGVPREVRSLLDRENIDTGQNCRTGDRERVAVKIWPGLDDVDAEIIRGLSCHHGEHSLLPHRGWKCPNPLSWFPKIELLTIDVNSVVIVGEFVIIVFLLILLLVKW